MHFGCRPALLGCDTEGRALKVSAARFQDICENHFPGTAILSLYKGGVPSATVWVSKCSHKNQHKHREPAQGENIPSHTHSLNAMRIQATGYGVGGLIMFLYHERKGISQP